MGPFLETLFGGLMSGMLYSLVALGFVLIFKASGYSIPLIKPPKRVSRNGPISVRFRGRR